MMKTLNILQKRMIVLDFLLDGIRELIFMLKIHLINQKNALIILYFILKLNLNLKKNLPYYRIYYRPFCRPYKF
uniref:Uncharacterized protein n=1 Tax=Meloidogyne enterolobii TaxID=390850 RepID=A0A6V7Y169_MELEN|nr:unnamed protein product [Meloidogyne enterolobii]